MVSKALAFSLSTTITGVLVGVALGLVGKCIALETRIILATVAVVAGLVIGAIDLAIVHIPVVERNCETPRRWLRYGALRWAIVNGVALGLGFTSRVGYWIWYLIPVASLLFADVILGAAVYSAYALFRGMSVWITIWRWRRFSDVDDMRGPFPRFAMARRVMSAQLIVISLISVLVVGL